MNDLRRNNYLLILVSRSHIYIPVSLKKRKQKLITQIIISDIYQIFVLYHANKYFWVLVGLLGDPVNKRAKGLCINILYRGHMLFRHPVGQQPMAHGNI